MFKYFTFDRSNLVTDEFLEDFCNQYGYDIDRVKYHNSDIYSLTEAEIIFKHLCDILVFDDEEEYDEDLFVETEGPLPVNRLMIYAGSDKTGSGESKFFVCKCLDCGQYFNLEREDYDAHVSRNITVCPNCKNNLK